MVPNISIDNSYEILISEYEKLQKTIESLPKDSEITIPDIITLYYQIVLVQTMTKKLKSVPESSQNSEIQKSVKITEIQNYIKKNFSNSLHSVILSQLTNSIENSTENLQLLGNNSEQKTKETIEKEALLYKKLRELMSTKEFVKQYETGLKDD